MTYYNYTEDEEVLEKIGAALAVELKLKRSPTHKDRWDLASGDKTNIGLAATVIRIIEEKGEGWEI